MKRVYKTVAVEPATAGFGVALDGRRLKTPGGRDMVVPTAAMATSIAAEWDRQQQQMRPETMPLTRIANTALDRVAGNRDGIVEEVANYAGTDLVCYRAAHPPALLARQQQVWQPLIDWALLRYDAPLQVTAGVIPTRQPPESLRAFAAAIAALDDFTLAAVALATAACGSLVVALAMLEGRIDAEAAFAASQLDESFQIEAWGEDAEQAERRCALAADIAAAARFLALLRG
jgi:chaperone required for assembly of F1-ATPase